MLGVLFDEEGRVLLAKHALRVRTPWGLPGGFVERGEHPAQALAREFLEELHFGVEVRELLCCVDEGTEPRHDGPSGLALVYACRLTSAPPATSGDAVPVKSWELLDARWVPLGELDGIVREYESRAVRAAAKLPSAS